MGNSIYVTELCFNVDHILGRRKCVEVACTADVSEIPTVFTFMAKWLPTGQWWFS